jgi:DNA-binding response OmpR family regulator
MVVVRPQGMWTRRVVRNKNNGIDEHLVMQMLEPQLLITDDDRDFRLSLGEALTRRGYRIVLAGDGVEALELLKRQPIHLALLDVHMPRLDGLGMLRTLRDSQPSLPCILMSAKMDESIVHQAKELKTDWFLSKPFSLNFLADTIRNLLTQHYGDSSFC